MFFRRIPCKEWEYVILWGTTDGTTALQRNSFIVGQMEYGKHKIVAFIF